MDPFPVTVIYYLTQATFGGNALFLSTASEVHHPQLHSERGCAGEKITGQRLLASGQLRSRKNACALGFLILFHEGPTASGLCRPHSGRFFLL